MLESRKETYYGIDIPLHRISDYLWISNRLPNAQHLVNEFTFNNMTWMLGTYTIDEVEFIFNISGKVIE